MTLSFNEDLLPKTTYTISISDDIDIEGFKVLTFDNFSFTTFDNYIEVYKIEYDYNGGKPTTQNPTTYDMYSATFTLNNPTKKGYEFIGWSGTELTGKENLIVTIEQGSIGERSYTANYKLITYSISYELNEGQLKVENPTSYDVTSATITLNKPSKEGYFFTGWSGTGLKGTDNQTVSIEQGSTGNRTYTANYTPIKYSINYELDDGLTPVDNPTSYDITSATIILNNPFKDGFIFIGWTGSNGDKPQMTVTIESGSTGNKSFTANYSALDYSISYNLDGGILDSPNPTGYNKASDSITLNNPTKYGYNFIGWTGTDIVEPQMVVTIGADAEGNKTFTANYTPITYNISYTLNDGTVTKANPESYDITSSTIVLNNPIKEGYVFKGWTNDEITTPQTTVIIEKGSTGDKKFIANWKLNSFKLTINKGSGIDTVIGEGTYKYGATVNASCTMLEGYDFDFWTGNITESPFTMPDHDVIMQANAKLIEYTLDYDLKEGIVSSDNPTSYNILSDTITLINPTRLGYTFKGWSGTNLVGTNNLTVTIPQGSKDNRKYTANWKLDTYTITSNIGEGSLAVSNPTSYNINSNEITLNNPVPTKAFYHFIGWSGTDLNGNENLAVTIPQGSVGNREYTANYAPDTFTITYVNEGNPVDNPDSYDITTLSFLLNNPTKSGNDFLGWEGTGITPGTASKSVIIYKGSTGDRSYVASFTQRYTINYNLTGGSLASANPDSYNKYTDNIMLNNPTRTNYDFLGWVGTGIPSETASKSVVIYKGSTGNRSYVASFTERYKIDYDLTGGTLASANPDSYNRYTDNLMLNNPTRTNYDFLGWVGTGITPGTASKSVIIYKGSTGNRSYVASFTERYTIVYNLENGSVTEPNPISYNIFTDNITLNNPTKDGYEFVGWTEGTATFPQMLIEIPKGSTGNKTYTAHWVESITFTLPGGIPLVLHKCPHGTFNMGSPTDELGRSLYNESVHSVTLTKDFYIGKFEVTQAQYLSLRTSNPSYFKNLDDSPTRPVENLYLNDAKNFCASLTEYFESSLPSGYTRFDLPTEAQWEYACRAGTSSALNNGTYLSSETEPCQYLDVVAWYKENSNSRTHSVGQKKPNAWGLYDMHGNVNEFCLDYRDADWRIDYPTEPQTDPIHTTGDEVIIRGGCYSSETKRNRSASRDGKSPTSKFNTIGFRVVLISAP